MEVRRRKPNSPDFRVETFLLAKCGKVDFIKKVDPENHSGGGLIVKFEMTPAP